MDVSIIIPTKNGGELFEQVLKKIFEQKTRYEYEVICVVPVHRIIRLR